MGYVFSSKTDVKLIKFYGLKEAFFTPYTVQQNGMVERLIRTVKAQSVYLDRFEQVRHVQRIIADWMQCYNEERPHQSLKMKSHAESF